MAYSKARRLADIMSTSAGIPTASIQDDAITSAKIGVDVIVAEDLAANAVTVSEITDGVITEAKLNIDNTPTNDYVLTAKSSAAGGLTWAAASQWSATTEGLVTTTQGQNNIDFTIPADVNMIKVVFYGLSQVSTELFEIKVGNASGTIKGSGYYTNTSTYWYHNNSPSLSENTDSIKLNGWTAAGNYWYGTLNMESVALDGRRWSYFMAPYNDTYGEYFTLCNGRIGLDSGEQIRKIRFTTASGNGYDSGGNIKVYTATF